MMSNCIPHAASVGFLLTRICFTLSLFYGTIVQMRFHNKALNYNTRKNPDVIEVTTPAIEMNRILKSFVEQENYSEPRRELAQLEFDDRLECLFDIFDEMPSGEDRDKAMIEELNKLYDTLSSISYLDEDIVIEARDAMLIEREETDSLRRESETTELSSPLVSLNARMNKVFNDNDISSAKTGLIFRAFEQAQVNLKEYGNDMSAITDVIEGFEELIEEVLAMSEDKASEALNDNYLSRRAEELNLSGEREDIAQVVLLRPARGNRRN